MQDILKELGEIAGQENIFGQSSERAACATWPFSRPLAENDLPLAVARPRHTGHLRELLRYCHKHALPVRARGGGTSTAMRENLGGSIVISTTGLNRIIAIDADNRLATAQAGATCAELSRAARRHSLFYPLAWDNISTLGGSVADNAPGSRAVGYGAVSAFVRELEIFMSDGESFTASMQNDQPRKLDSLSLASLFCGSRGKLGIISQVKMHLLPAPQASKAMLAVFSKNTDAARAACAVMATSLAPAALEIVSGFYSSGFNANSKTLLYVEFDGPLCQIQDNLEQCGSVLSRNGSMSVQNADMAEYIPALSRLAAKCPGENFAFEKVCCPPARLHSLVEGINAIGGKFGVEPSFYGHAGTACLNVMFHSPDEKGNALAARDLSALELMLNNSLKSEEDAKSGRMEWLEKNQPPYAGKIRKIFDPAGIFSHD